MTSGNLEPQATRTLADAERAAASFMNWLEARATVDSDNTDFQTEQIGAILMAETAEEMWDADESDELDSSKDITDREMSIISYVVRKGDIQDSEIPYYMVVRAARLDNGEEFQFSTGAIRLMTKIKWLGDHDLLPTDCVIRATETSKGFNVLKLRKISPRAVRA